MTEERSEYEVTAHYVRENSAMQTSTKATTFCLEPVQFRESRRDSRSRTEWPMVMHCYARNVGLGTRQGLAKFKQIHS